MEIVCELVFFLLELLGCTVFEIVLPRLANRYGGCGCLIVAATLALLVGSIFGVIALL